MTEKQHSADEQEKKKHQEDDTSDDLNEIMDKLSEKESSGDEEAKPAGGEEEQTPVGPPAPAADEPENVEEILEKITEKEEDTPPEELNVWQRIVYVFTSPARLFTYLRYRPDYIVPILLTIIISVFATTQVYDIAINDRVAAVENNEKIPDERKNIIIDQMEASKEGTKRLIYTFVFPPIGILITFSLVTAIFLLIGNVFLGGKARFAQLLAAYSYSYLIMAIAGTAVKLPLWLAKGTLKVNTSLALFMPASASQTTLYQFLSSFDFFTLWFLLVFGIGFAAIYRFSQLKGILTVFVTWLIYVIFTKVVLGSIFGGMMG